MSRRNLWITLAALAAFIIALGAWQWWGGEDEPAIKVAAILPLTGNLAVSGEGAQRGLQMALEDINAAGGVNGRPIKIIYEDSKGDPATAVTAARRLVDVEGINIVMTSLTGVSLAVTPVITEHGGVQIVFAMDEAIPKGHDGVFRVYPGIREEGEAMLRFAQQTAPDSAGILYFEAAVFDGEAREVLLPGLEKLGVDQVLVETFQKLDAPRIRDLAAKFAEAKPDLVFILAYYTQIPLLLETFAEYGMLASSRIVGGINLVYAVDQDRVSSELSEGLVAAVPLYSFMKRRPANEDTPASRFAARYKERYGEMPNLDGSYGYEALQLIALALRGEGQGPTAVAENLRRIDKHDGVVGSLSIADDGNAVTPWLLVQYRAGEMISLETAIGN